MTVTADAARVQRYPGSYNFKPIYPEPPLVQILEEGVLFDFEIISAAIRGQLQAGGTPAVTAPSNVVSLPGTRPSLAPSAPSVMTLIASCPRCAFAGPDATAANSAAARRSLASRRFIGLQ
jgi:hypothetical protein